MGTLRPMLLLTGAAVIHLASVIRDRRAGSIEDLAGSATVGLRAAAEEAVGARYELAGPDAFATRDEAELLDASLLAAHGTADCNRLGVSPPPIAAVLGA